MNTERYYIYYKIGTASFLAWNSETETIDRTTFTEMYRYRKYKMMKYGGCEGTPEGLQQYVQLFHQWNDEIKRNKVINIDWFDYFNNNSAVALTFARLCKGTY